MPFLTYPLALIALASLPALAAIYVFRNRFRRRQVSSLVLWQFHLQTKQGGAKVHRLQLPLIFFLELLALLLLVAAATGPHWNLPQWNRPLIVILDDSFSMRAVHDGKSVQTGAHEFLEKLFRRQTPPSTRLILAGKEPRLLGTTAKTWTELSEQLRQWTCWSPDASIDHALTLASEIGRQQANVLVLTDHAPTEGKITSDRLQWHAFGRPEDNLAIISATRTANGDDDRCFLEVANFSAESQESRLVVQIGSNATQSAHVSLASRDRQRFTFNVPASAPMLSAKLDDDALPEDNEVKLLPPLRKKVRVRVALTNSMLSELVSRTLDATGLRAGISASPELVIHDSAGSPAGSNSWDLRWIDGEATAYTGPFVIDSAHPLAEGISLQGVVWAASALTNSSGDVPVILAGNVPLLSVREDAANRWHLTLNLNPALSTLPNTPDWPILFWNVLRWRAAETPGLQEHNARLGAEVILKTTGETVTVLQPDGATKSFPRTSDQLALETPVPGIYSVTMGAATNSFAVNPLVADESDLSVATTGQWGEWRTDGEKHFAEASLVWTFALAALAAMIAHLWLLARGKGGA